MWLIRVTFTCLVMEGLIGSTLPFKPSIVIVGSGPSGIAAATRLLKNNYTNLRILEAENRIGGRVNSIKFGDAYVDLGAEYCHGEEDNIVYSLVKDLDVLEHSVDSVTFYYSNGDVIDEKTAEMLIHFAESLAASNKTIDGCQNVLSIGECLAIKTKVLQTTTQDVREKNIFSSATDWTNSYLSSYDSTLNLNDLTITSEYKKCRGDLHMNWNGKGYKTILEVMMQKHLSKKDQLSIDDKILLGKIVNNISNWREDKLTVTTTDGNIYEADHVIFTPSVGVLKANHEYIFSPPLPKEKIDAIKNIGYGAIAKVLLHFPKKWWSNDELFWTFLWSSEDKAKLKEKQLEWLINLNGFLQAENNPNVLIAWYAGSYIPLIEALPETKLLEGHQYIIKTFFAPNYNGSISEPDELIRTTWYSNMNFRGTYSYESVKGHSTGGKDFQAKLGKPLINNNNKPTVLFAGEATHPYYFSTVHGAIESGYREADRIINLYKH